MDQNSLIEQQGTLNKFRNDTFSQNEQKQQQITCEQSHQNFSQHQNNNVFSSQQNFSMEVPSYQTKQYFNNFIYQYKGQQNQSHQKKVIYQDRNLVSSRQNEFNSKRSFEVQKFQPNCLQKNYQRFQIGLQSIDKSLTKIFYRNFHNRLITFYIQILKDEQRKIRQTKQIQIKSLKQQNWPFKELFYKKHKTPNDIIMFQFVNMCAQKIQSTFKSYIAHKRHQQATKRLFQFKEKLTAVTLGWKIWNIFNCKKVKQIRNNALQINKQIDREISNPNTDKYKKMKKIEYLNLNQESARQNFRKIFYRLFQNGTWIFEVDRCFKEIIPKNKKYITAITNKQFESNHIHQQHIQPTFKKNKTENKSTQLKNDRRKRQFAVPSAMKQDKPHLNNLQGKQMNNNSKQSQKRQQIPTNYKSSQFQDRPIVAKGQYQFEEDNHKNSENQFLKSNDEKINQNRQLEQSIDPNVEKRVNKFQDQEKKRLVKRQRYDPRKAIQDQKKRIEEQKMKLKNIDIQSLKNQTSKIESKNIAKNEKTPPKQKNKTPSKINKKTPLNSKNQQKKQLVESPREQSKDKTVQKIKKQSKLVKKDDNSKSIKSILNKKVNSKIDCWGSKKQLSTQIVNEESSYKSKYLNSLKQKNQEKPSFKQQKYLKEHEIREEIQQINAKHSYSQYSIEQKLQKLINLPKHIIRSKNEQTNIESRQQIQDEMSQKQKATYQSSYLKKLVQLREKGSFSYGNLKIASQRNSSSIQIIPKTINSRRQQSNQQISKNSIQNNRSLANLKTMEQQRKVILQQNSQVQILKTKQQVHRSVQSLQDVYSSQYTDRLGNLKSKLNMLQSTRYIQRDESIPILLQDSKFVHKIYKDYTFSTLYWPQVKTMETNFLDYIRYSLQNI